MLDDWEELNKLKRKYGGLVQWVGRDGVGDVVVRSDAVVCQLKVRPKDFLVKARIKREGRCSSWVSLSEISVYIDRELRAKNDSEPGDELAVGKWLLRTFKASFKWVDGHYMEVAMPATLTTPEWIGWVRFTTQEPRRRKWSDKKRQKLHASGLYAWTIELREHGLECKLYYTGPGKLATYCSEWFPHTMLHKMLVTCTEQADKFKWRDREIAEIESEYVAWREQERRIDVETTAQVAAAVDTALDREVKEAAERAAKRKEQVMRELKHKQQRAEIAREADSSWVEEGVREWTSDIRERYVGEIPPGEGLIPEEN